jgi:hypothetical protein
MMAGEHKSPFSSNIRRWKQGSSNMTQFSIDDEYTRSLFISMAAGNIAKNVINVIE